MVFHGLHSGFIETLQASRNPNPNMTFPLFLGALLLQIAALRRRSLRLAVLAGVVAGLLFFSYIYYALSWSAAALLLTVIAGARRRDLLTPSLTALLATIAMGVPFLFWVSAAKKAGGYQFRTARLGMVYSHLPSSDDLKLGAIYTGCLILLAICWNYLSRRRAVESAGKAHPFEGASTSRPGLAFLVFSCAAAGGILGMNMSLVTGFNIQANHHFTHMVIQPALVVLCFMILLAATERTRQAKSSRLAIVPFLALFAICSACQVEAAVNSAPAHRIIPSERTLFFWLNKNTSPSDVVATTSLELAIYMPLYSKDYTLMVEGTRTSASDDEILARYLLAEKLVGAPASTIAQDLTSARAADDTEHAWWTYPNFFFEHSLYLEAPFSLKPWVVRKELAEYASLNVADELRHFRVNYLYTVGKQEPAKIAGISFSRVLKTADGSLWRLTPQTEP